MDLSRLYEAIVNGKADAGTQAATEALAEGMDPAVILNQSMIPAMEEVGRRFERSEYFIPQMLMSARAMKLALEVLKPRMIGQKIEPIGCVVIGTVQGDMHDIGKNLVSAMMEGCGFRVVDLGVDVSPEKFADAVRIHQAGVLALSALLTATMLNMKNVIDEISRQGLRDQVKIIIGGAPVSQDYADEIGADGYTDNSNAAAILAKQMITSC